MKRRTIWKESTSRFLNRGAVVLAAFILTATCSTPVHSQESPQGGPPDKPSSSSNEKGTPPGSNSARKGQKGSGSRDTRQRPPGGGQSRSYELKGAYTLNGGSAGSTNETYTSTTNDVSAIMVSGGGNLRLVNPTVKTSGNSSSTENSSFYGLNAAVLATRSSKIEINGGSISTSGTGANGLFATGAGASVTMTGGTITATGSGGHGVMASGGGSLALTNVDIVTTSERAAPVATDRGSGTIVVSGGKMKSAGRGSPGIYSTGKITVYGTEFVSTGAEAAVIEGRNSISLVNCTLTGAARCGVMIYQSFSGDAEGREGHFTMSGGSLTATSGPLFFVTNSKGVIQLNDVKASAASGVLVKAGIDRWGREGSNGGIADFTANAENLTGDLVAEASCSVSATLQNGTKLTGAIKDAALTLDASSQWSVTADSTLTSLTNPTGLNGDQITNIHGNGHEVRYQAKLPANEWLKGKTYTLAGGGRLVPIP